MGKDCVISPQVGEFVKFTETDEWYKVKKHGFKYLEIVAVLAASASDGASATSTVATTTVATSTVASSAVASNAVASTDVASSSASSSGTGTSSNLLPVLNAGPSGSIRPSAAVRDPEVFETFVDYWLDHLPDLTDCPVIRAEDLCFWRKSVKGHRKDRRKAHCLLPGLNAQKMNESIDFAISKNIWPVEFYTDKDTSSETLHELVSKFAVAVWVFYCAKMVK